MMRRVALTVGLFLLMGATMASVSRGNFVVNGGFETGDLSGWSSTVVDGNPDARSAGDPYIPYEGSFLALLGSQNGEGSPSQTLPTSAGQIYTFQFALQHYNFGAGSDSQNDFTASWDGNPVLSFGPFGTSVNEFPWTVETFKVTGTGSDTIAFSRDVPGYYFLDAVDVEPYAPRLKAAYPNRPPSSSGRSWALPGSLWVR